MTETVSVEVVFALPEKQLLLSLDVEERSSAASVVEQSGILGALGALAPLDRASLTFGVWGRPVDGEYRVCDGDRIEIYRPLAIDPRDARRQLALCGRTMGHSLRD